MQLPKSEMLHRSKLQFFAGSPLNRSTGDRKNPSFLLNCATQSTSKWIVHYGGKTAFSRSANGALSVALFDSSLVVSLTPYRTIEELIQSKVLVIVLGEIMGVWYLAIDCSSFPPKLQDVPEYERK